MQTKKALTTLSLSETQRYFGQRVLLVCLELVSIAWRNVTFGSIGKNFAAKPNWYHTEIKTLIAIKKELFFLHQGLPGCRSFPKNLKVG